MLGYMLTWTTYGTWLQGDKREYVKDSEILNANPGLEGSNRKVQSQETILLEPTQQKLVQASILEEAKKMNHLLYAISVKKTHVHMVVPDHPKGSSAIVAIYKNAGRQALRKTSAVGKVWTKGYDIRYCYNEQILKQRINYVNAHRS